MTAPRQCRACRAGLPTDLRWCLRCYAPVLDLAPRDRQLPPLEHVDEPPLWINRSPLRDSGPPPTYSRWRAGPTTFGPVGRITVTTIVLLLFPWDAFFTLNPFRLWFMLGYTIVAAYVLRHTWRRERVMVERSPSPAPGRRRRLNARAGALSRRVDARAVVGALAIAILAGVTYAWINLDAVGRYAIVAVGVVGAGALAWSWWTES